MQCRASNQNLFVIYAPGSFGSHIANVISLDSKFAQSFDLRGYDNEASNAHHGRPTFAQISQYPQSQQDQILNQSNVWAEHMSTMMAFRDTDLYQAMANKYFLIVNLPRHTSQAFRRMRSIGFDATIMAFNEIQSIYYPDSAAALLKTAKHRFFNIEAEMIYQPDAVPVIKHITQSAPIDLNLDLDLCCTLHEKWYRSVSNSL